MDFLKKGQLWIGLACIVLGIVLAIQFKIVQKNYLEGLNPSVVSSQLISDLTKTRSEKEKLQNQVDALQAKIDQIEESAADESTVVKNLKEEIVKYKIMSGFENVKGPGVEVLIDNPSSDLTLSNEMNILTEYDMVLRLINELHASGAEAVSINNQRIITTSEIRTAGKNLNVNSVPVTAPLIVKAIGKIDTLEGTLNQRFGIVSEIRDTGYLIEVKRDNNIEIEKYGGIIDFEYTEITE